LILARVNAKLLAEAGGDYAGRSDGTIENKVKVAKTGKKVNSIKFQKLSGK
jgi:hypothetical protein